MVLSHNITEAVISAQFKRMKRKAREVFTESFDNQLPENLVGGEGFSLKPTSFTPNPSSFRLKQCGSIPAKSLSRARIPGAYFVPILQATADVCVESPLIMTKIDILRQGCKV